MAPADGERIVLVDVEVKVIYKLMGSVTVLDTWLIISSVKLSNTGGQHKLEKTILLYNYIGSQNVKCMLILLLLLIKDANRYIRHRENISRYNSVETYM